MARIGSMLGVFVVLVVSGVAQAGIIDPNLSTAANFIKNRDYLVLNTDNSIGPLDANLFPDEWKANGTRPSVGDGLVVWEDGRSGKQSVMGFVLASPGEFLISDVTDAWQEGNPFAGYNAAGGYTWTVYDADTTDVSGDPGDIQGSALPPDPNWLVQKALQQRTPVFTNLPLQECFEDSVGTNNVALRASTILSWVHDPLTTGLGGKDNIDIWTIPVPPTIPLPSPLTVGATHITAGKTAPRDALAGDGRYLTWQEFREDAGTLMTSWDIVVYDLVDGNFRYIDAPDALKHQIDPDINGGLVVFTQVENPTTGETNIYFQDISPGSSSGPIAITTAGTARGAAISRHDGNYFVVWQDHPLADAGDANFTGNETDFSWDIWGHEITNEAGVWVLHAGGPFLIRADVGRQYVPDIDGLDVVWQSQAVDTGEVYVWGPVPEPCTAVVVGIAAPFLLAARRKRRKEKK